MTVYTNTARFDTGRALTESEMFRIAPSIFATQAHESRSERFRPIPTIEIVRGLAKEGFAVVGAKQSVTRVPDKAPYTKHLLRIRKMDAGVTHRVGDTVMEMLLKNANDGTAAYDLMAGLFRICCLNSLVAQKDTIDTLKVRHSGDVMGKVIEGTYRVMTAAEQVMAAPQDWAQLKLAREEQAALAEAAHVLRFGEVEDERPATIDPSRLLAPRRVEDANRNDLWTTFNVVQENMIKGGLRGVSINAETGVRRRQTTRAVTGIDQDVRLNKALWLLGERMAQLKS
jgi:ribosomal protein L30/L7E